MLANFELDEELNNVQQESIHIPHEVSIEARRKGARSEKENSVTGEPDLEEWEIQYTEVADELKATVAKPSRRRAILRGSNRNEDGVEQTCRYIAGNGGENKLKEFKR